MRPSGRSFDTSNAYVRLITTILLPFVLGGSVGAQSHQEITESVVARKHKPEPLKRLTLDDLRKLLTVEPEVILFFRDGASRRVDGMPQEEILLGMSPSLEQLNVAATRLEREADIKRLFEEHDWTGIEYLRILYATVGAILEVKMAQAVSRSLDTLGPNARLLLNLPAELAVEFQNWKQSRIGSN
jgi:hypothetical protein